MKRLAILIYFALSLSLYRQVVSAVPATEPTTAPRFLVIEVLLDPHGKPLAAYQIEISGESDQIKLVGVEGGDHPAYHDAPYYDPAALSHHRIVLAALSTAANLPTKQFRAARLHVEVLTRGTPDLKAKLIVAANATEQTISANVSLSEGAKP